MLKKVILIFSIILFQTSATYAATQLKVLSLEDYNTAHPKKNISVQLVEPVVLGKYNIETNSIIRCEVTDIVSPKRGKRDASFWVRPISYTDNGNVIVIKDKMYGKYSTKFLTREELKKVPKKAALMVGDYFMTGVSAIYNFGEGVVKNEKDNRLKSGVVSVYESSPVSYISKGEHLDIKVSDNFYLVFKLKDEDDEDIEELSESDN